MSTDRHKENYNTLPPEEVLGWVEAVSGDTIQNKKDVKESLKDGRTLCNLINKIKPGTIKKIHNSKLNFMKMENLSFFVRAAKQLGVDDSDMMSVVDLFDGSNIPQVLICLEALSRVSRKVDGFEGPFIGAKMSKKNERKAPRKKGEGVAESIWETKMKTGYAKAKVYDRQKHNVVRVAQEERNLYNKEFNEDND